ncbi:hypothetical protein TNCV_2773421 [Trichonephila clavipes]|nr:hypothetical protein TNCV_2773421 [Trichonephila clavipes]
MPKEPLETSQKERRRKIEVKTGKEVNDPSSICSQRVGTKAPATKTIPTAHVCTLDKSVRLNLSPPPQPYSLEPTSTASQSPKHLAIPH